MSSFALIILCVLAALLVCGGIFFYFVRREDEEERRLEARRRYRKVAPKKTEDTQSDFMISDRPPAILLEPKPGVDASRDIYLDAAKQALAEQELQPPPPPNETVQHIRRVIAKGGNKRSETPYPPPRQARTPYRAPVTPVFDLDSHRRGQDALETARRRDALETERRMREDEDAQRQSDFGVFDIVAGVASAVASYEPPATTPEDTFSNSGFDNDDTFKGGGGGFGGGGASGEW